jgi:2-phospho-L-lactate guanylyltransferase (CobY/MobA/RfbA family)
MSVEQTAEAKGEISMADNSVSMLGKVVRELGKRYDELKGMLSEVFSFSRREDIVQQMELVNLTIMQMETKLNHIKASLVVVSPPSTAERAAMKAAIEKMSPHVAKNQTWSKNVKIINVALKAANEIRSNIEKRQG